MTQYLLSDPFFYGDTWEWVAVVVAAYVFWVVLGVIIGKQWE